MTDGSVIRPRRQRMLRNEEPPDDLVVVIRAADVTEASTVATMVDDALVSADSYVVLVNGRPEILFGISVFARPTDPSAPHPLERFSGAPTFLEMPVGAIRAAGFAVLPTGVNPQHFDVQLVGGRQPDSAADDAGTMVRQAAEVLVRSAGPLRPNPFYDGPRDTPQEEAD